MAFWVVGGSDPPDVPEQLYGSKRTAYFDHDHDDDYRHKHEATKRARLEDWEGIPHRHHQPSHQDHLHPPSPYAESESIRVKKLAFLVIREGTQTPENHHDPYHHHHHHHRPPPPLHPPAPRAMTPPPPPPPAVLYSSAAMERTESGISISSDTSTYTTHSDPEDNHSSLATSPPLLTDLQAAHLVLSHVQSSRPDSQPSRILRSLVRPRMESSSSSSSSSRAFPLDDTALRSLFRAANALFFAHRLSNRVAWDWSHASSSPRYAHHVVGTTALRHSAERGGYETLIVLSSPILRDTRYNRRLLIATFLHEMIHSFLFVTCGMKAARGGGHTEGFRMIAETIDAWVGREHLRLADMEADLERFRDGEEEVNVARCGREAHGAHVAYPPMTSHHHQHGGWEWYEQEGFRTRGQAAGSLYVR